MKRIYALFLIISFIFAVFPGNARSLDVNAIIKKSEELLANTRLGTRKLVYTLKEGDQVSREWVARYADKAFSDGKRALMVIIEPEELKGNAHLYWIAEDNTIIEWVYFTITRRVRKLKNVWLYDSFLGTDFSYSDIGTKDPRGMHRFLGEEVCAGLKAYKVETVPYEKWYYSRIISWISTETFLPIQRDYYDAGGVHWKTKLFENVKNINNRPTPLQIRMLDVQNNHCTEITVDDISYDVGDLPDETFDPEGLPRVLLSPVCTTNRLKQ